MKSQRDIDKIIELVKLEYPEVGVWQLEVKILTTIMGFGIFGCPKTLLMIFKLRTHMVNVHLFLKQIEVPK